MLNWLRWLPENVSTYGGDIDSIIALIWYSTAVWFVLTFGTIGLFLILYRRRAGRPAAYVKGERLAEALWVLVPVVMVLAIDLWLDFRGAPVWAKVMLERPPAALSIQVTGKQFNWEVVYPGPDSKFGTADDRQFDNELHVPVGKPVRLLLKSKDVIHSFFSPHLRLKQDIVPGRAIEAWFEATKPGKYELPCAELCGFGHSGMKGWLYVHPEEDYNRWVKEQWS
ncbi:MAG: cytochrome c oxidase subunit II [Candidatus Rokubacteria bacterium]|nr:cytochrome c oxidase subunit II [Candidatus Rokubacteria bacterium]